MDPGTLLVGGGNSELGSVTVLVMVEVEVLLGTLS
jgi:hypothetical protein